MRHVPAAGINLFLMIYGFLREYQEKTGRPPLNLSLGNPDGIPPLLLRGLQAKYAADSGFEYHTYAEDKNLNHFVEGMVLLHAGILPSTYPHLRALPTAGIKTATALIPLACGLSRRAKRADFTVASNLPAYDMIGTWSQSYLGGKRVVWPVMASDGMRPQLKRLKKALSAARVKKLDLVFTILPGNPAAIGGSVAGWKELIEFCVQSGARLVNDAAYAGLAAKGTHATLASVAKDYPKLEWMELYSVSKSFSDPGARLGALIGSRDFVDDYALIKGNTDSGPVPAVMAGYGEFLADQATAQNALDQIRGLYERRLRYLIPKLTEAGLLPACKTEAGFFTLWKVPKSAFGRALPARDRHLAFNRAVIEETGIVGVHFLGQDEKGRPEPLIRYAVCSDVLNPEFQARFEEGLSRLKPVY